MCLLLMEVWTNPAAGIDLAVNFFSFNEQDFDDHIANLLWPLSRPIEPARPPSPGPGVESRCSWSYS